MDLTHLPPQPGEDRWRFTEDLQSPLWTRHNWGSKHPGPQHADLSAGVRLELGFPDPQGRLDTAYEDLRLFLAAGDVDSEGEDYLIETSVDSELDPEAYRIEVEATGCRLVAADTEGVRRAVFHLEDRMRSERGPFLPIGTVERRPFIRRRISRCFFGPIKRPPKMRDELMDDVDYYPEQYLNRLAHEGVNGLWLTVEFRNLCTTAFTPSPGRDAERRLAKLRRTVDACLRYGIRTYIFCIEPRAWDADTPVPEAYPELAGSKSGERQCFCPSSETARQYLYEAVNGIFTAVPGLGGIINITHGERPTTCLSSVSAVREAPIDCPRCSDKRPWEILHASLSAMERGMHDAAPDAELISWLYMPQSRGAEREGLADWVYEIPAHTPEGVILQFNFETGVRRTEFGREFVGGDYWLSTPGPSDRFERVAETGRDNGTPISAKIQTACSHEVATVPYVPVPSLLHRKFSGMRRLGVSHTMLCWYFGNYPGLMNKAAGELSFEPFPEDEGAFLEGLASIDWGQEHAPAVAEAWKAFAAGYENYPLINLFQFYGPVQDGPVWPLLLKPEDAPLSPTWLLGSTTTREPWPPSGDRIGECIMEAFSLDEAVELARRMSASWDRGVGILKNLEPGYAEEPERLLDIGVAQALGIQLRSSYNILRFYRMREQMFRTEGDGRLEILSALADIIQEELDLNQQLLALCERDSRLGFHSEAEGYKYFPEKIRWRMDQLQVVLDTDVPELKARIENGESLFPQYTGERPEGAVARSTPGDGSVWSDPELSPPSDLDWQACTFGPDSTTVQWAASHDDGALCVIVRGSSADGPPQDGPPVSSVLVKLEPRRLWPCKHFQFSPGVADLAEILDHVGPQSVDGRLTATNGGWRVVIRIPFDRAGLDAQHLHPLRLDVRVQTRGRGSAAWRPNNPTTSRLRLGTDNPADLGWLVFEPTPTK